MIRFLCLDYGLKHTGLAIATTPLAEPVATVSTDQAIPNILHLIDKHRLEAIIIGISEGQMAQEIKQFGQQVKNATNLPLIYHDETLSSLETRQRLAQARLKKSKREQKIDHLVAAAILQDYLDSQPAS